MSCYVIYIYCIYVMLYIYVMVYDVIILYLSCLFAVGFQPSTPFLCFSCF